MTRLARILIAGTAALMPMTQAFADGSSESQIINGQINLNSIWTNNNMEMNNTIVDNNQYASGAAIGADLNATVTNVNGSVNLNTQVACNTADISTDPAYTIVNSTQECNVGDP